MLGLLLVYFMKQWLEEFSVRYNEIRFQSIISHPETMYMLVFTTHVPVVFGISGIMLDKLS